MHQARNKRSAFFLGRRWRRSVHQATRRARHLSRRCGNTPLVRLATSSRAPASDHAKLRAQNPGVGEGPRGASMMVDSERRGALSQGRAVDATLATRIALRVLAASCGYRAAVRAGQRHARSDSACCACGADLVLTDRWKAAAAPSAARRIYAKIPARRSTPTSNSPPAGAHTNDGPRSSLGRTDASRRFVQASARAGRSSASAGELAVARLGAADPMQWTRRSGLEDWNRWPRRSCRASTIVDCRRGFACRPRTRLLTRRLARVQVAH